MGSRANGGIRRRPDGTWQCYFRVDGVRVWESCETRDERAARAYLAARRREVREGTFRPKTDRLAVLRVEEARAALARALEAAPEPAPLTLGAYLDGWVARRLANGVRFARDERALFTTYVRPVLGEVPIAELTRTQLRDFVAELQRRPSPKTGKPLASRTVLHAYRSLSTALADAVLEGVIPVSPATLKTRRGELPRKRDRDAAWRASAVYSLDEAEHLLTDPRVPADRRAFYALCLLAGLRANEACGRRWRDLDATAQPLARLVVATQADGAQGSRETKTAETREVPIVPALADVLDDWRRVGFPLLFGRHARPEDPIVPSRGDMTARSFRNPTVTHDRLVEDLKRIGARVVPSAQHAMRATFLSRLEAVGANMAIARRATHAAPVDVVGGYIRTSWADLCREVGKLDVRLDRELASVSSIGTVEAVDEARGAPRAVSAAVSVAGIAPKSSRKAMGPAGFEPAHAPL